MVTAQFLLEGIMYSLEQTGVLLRDASCLYRAGSYSSSIVLAAFAREELGRACILRDLRDKVLAGENVTVQEIKDECGNHVTKHERGQLSLVQRATDDQGLGKQLRARQNNHSHSPQYKRAEQQLDSVTRIMTKRTPQTRHELREKSLYVDPNENASGWNRPCQKSANEASTFLEDAMNDYRGMFDRFQGGSLEWEDEVTWQALQEWPDRPELPAPQWL